MRRDLIHRAVLHEMCPDEEVGLACATIRWVVDVALKEVAALYVDCCAADASIRSVCAEDRILLAACDLAMSMRLLTMMGEAE